MTYFVDEWEHKSVNSCNIVKFVFNPPSLCIICLQVEPLSSFLPTLLILLGSECECRARRWLGCTFSILVVTVLLQVVLPRLPHSKGWMLANLLHPVVTRECECAQANASRYCMLHSSHLVHTPPLSPEFSMKVLFKNDSSYFHVFWEGLTYILLLSIICSVLAMLWK